MPKAKVILHFVKDLIDDRRSHRNVLEGKMFLEISQNSQENTWVRVSFLIKVQASVCNFIKNKTLAEVFFCEFCEISKNTFFTEYLCIEIWQITCYLKGLRTLLRTLQFVYYSNKAPHLELDNPTKNLLTDVPHKYKKTLYSIVFLKFFICLFSSFFYF